MEQSPARIAGATTNTLTFVVYTDTISLSATNAAGGTRVIGVGCRYYTTLRRGVFICELLQPTAGVMNEPAEVVTRVVDLTEEPYIIFTICVGLRGCCK